MYSQAPQAYQIKGSIALLCQIQASNDDDTVICC